MLPITFQSENSKLEKKKLNFKITKLNCCLWQSTRREITITIEREGLESLKSCTVKICLPGNQTPGQGDTLWKGRGILDKCKEVLVCLTFNKVSHLTKLGMVGTCAMPKKRRVFRGQKLAIMHSDSGLLQQRCQADPFGEYAYFCLVSLCARGMFNETKNIMFRMLRADPKANLFISLSVILKLGC